MGGVFVSAHKSIIEELSNTLGGQSDIYGGIVAPTIIAWMTLYVTICGYKALAGKLHSPLPDVVWNLGVTGILLAFVTNASGWFSMVDSAISGISVGFANSDGDGIWGQLDSLWGKTQELAEKLSRVDDSMVPVSGSLAKILVWAGTALVVFPGGIINLTAEVTLKLLITTGPLFIACLAWGWFRSMFENWMKAIMSCLLTALFTSLSLNMILTIMNNVLPDVAANYTGTNIITTAMLTFGYGLLGMSVILLAVKLAHSLSGSTVTATALSMATSAAGGAIGGAKAVNNKLDKNKRESKQDAHRAAMLEVAKGPNSGGESVMSQMRKSSIDNMSRFNK